eukprot:TRINITY_DN15340_c0_g1_i4.p1 TRINITY_DN15340_c0_g1~~TRINITY_DN15340_c0_g1_i4.p1  ORF type:complete len:600 (+),score=148.58 TRINITY_DN15340_c0_g1_i4:108-1907(+)
MRPPRSCLPTPSPLPPAPGPLESPPCGAAAPPAWQPRPSGSVSSPQPDSLSMGASWAAAAWAACGEQSSAGDCPLQQSPLDAGFSPTEAGLSPTEAGPTPGQSAVEQGARSPAELLLDAADRHSLRRQDTLVSAANSWAPSAAARSQRPYAAFSRRSTTQVSVANSYLSASLPVLPLALPGGEPPGEAGRRQSWAGQSQPGQSPWAGAVDPAVAPPPMAVQPLELDAGQHHTCGSGGDGEQSQRSERSRRSLLSAGDAGTLAPPAAPPQPPPAAAHAAPPPRAPMSARCVSPATPQTAGQFPSRHLSPPHPAPQPAPPPPEGGALLKGALLHPRPAELWPAAEAAEGGDEEPPTPALVPESGRVHAPSVDELKERLEQALSNITQSAEAAPVAVALANKDLAALVDVLVIFRPQAQRAELARHWRVVIDGYVREAERLRRAAANPPPRPAPAPQPAPPAPEPAAAPPRAGGQAEPQATPPRRAPPPTAAQLPPESSAGDDAPPSSSVHWAAPPRDGPAGPPPAGRSPPPSAAAARAAAAELRGLLGHTQDQASRHVSPALPGPRAAAPATRLRTDAADLAELLRRLPEPELFVSPRGAH